MRLGAAVRCCRRADDRPVAHIRPPSPAARCRAASGSAARGVRRAAGYARCAVPPQPVVAACMRWDARPPGGAASLRAAGLCPGGALSVQRASLTRSGATAQMPHPWFQMLQDEEAEAEAAPEEAAAGGDAAGADAAGGGDVVFPDDYPNSVKHFLMLGAIGFLMGAIVFLTLNFMRAKRSTAHSVSGRELPARLCRAGAPRARLRTRSRVPGAAAAGLWIWRLLKAAKAARAPLAGVPRDQPQRTVCRRALSRRQRKKSRKLESNPTEAPCTPSQLERGTRALVMRAVCRYWLSCADCLPRPPPCTVATPHPTPPCRLPPPARAVPAVHLHPLDGAGDELLRHVDWPGRHVQDQ